MKVPGATFICDGSDDTTWTGETAQLPPGWAHVRVSMTDAEGRQVLHMGTYCPTCLEQFVAPAVHESLSTQFAARADLDRMERSVPAEADRVT